MKKLLKAEREKLAENGKIVIDDKLSLVETVKRSFSQQPTLL